MIHSPEPEEEPLQEDFDYANSFGKVVLNVIGYLVCIAMAAVALYWGIRYWWGK